MIYDLAQPINIIFNVIDDWVEYARAVEVELTQSQTINLALVILNRQRIFKYYIRVWKCTNQAYKIWENFKHDFREAHLELRENGGTNDELGFHNANAIVDQMMARLQIDGDKCTDTATQHSTELASINQANATTESHMKTALTQVQALQLANAHNYENNYGRGRRRGHGRGAVRGCGCPRPSAPPTPKYCWTTETADTTTKNAHTLPTDTRRMRPSCT